MSIYSRRLVSGVFRLRAELLPVFAAQAVGTAKRWIWRGGSAVSCAALLGALACSGGNGSTGSDGTGATGSGVIGGGATSAGVGTGSPQGGPPGGPPGECGLGDGSVAAETIDLNTCDGPTTLPGTGYKYCALSHSVCKQEGANCPVYIAALLGTGTRLLNPEKYGPIVSVDLLEPAGTDPLRRDVLAELPRELKKYFKGMDMNRIYLMGASRGSGMISAVTGDDADNSPYGTTSDIYAAVAAAAGCVFLSNGEPARSPHFPVFMVYGTDDDIGHCDDPPGTSRHALQNWSTRNSCGDATQGEVPWSNVQSGDVFVGQGDGTDIAQKIAFTDCPKGDVIGYRFKDEVHVQSFGKHFDPKISASALIWDFFQGRTRDGTGYKGVRTVCAP